MRYRTVHIIMLVLISVTLALAAPPAFASDTTEFQSRGPMTITATGRWIGHTTSSGSLDVEASCAVQATGLVEFTYINDCRLVLDGTPSTNHFKWTPGPAPVATGFTQTVTTLDIQLCWTATATPLLDPPIAVQTSGCTPPAPASNTAPSSIGQSTQTSPT